MKERQSAEPAFVSLQPEGWAVSSLAALLQSLESGSRPRGGVRGYTEGVPSLGGEHLDADGGIRTENVKYVPRGFYESMTSGHIDRGDLLIVKDGATTGKIALVDSEFPYAKAVVNEHVFICRLTSGILPPFVFWFLWSKEGQERILANFKGSAQGGINRSFAPGTCLPIAPSAEQKRIVAKVAALLSQLRSVRHRLAAAPRILERFRQAVLAHACSGKLTEDWRAPNDAQAEVGDDELPGGWQRCALRDLCTGFEYGSSQKSEQEGDVPVLRMGNIQDGEIDWGDLKYSSDQEEIAKYSLEPNTVLFNRTNSPELVGKTAIYRRKRPAIFAGYLIRIVHGPQLNPEYLNYCLNEQAFREYCMQVKSDGVSQSNINAKKLAAYEVPLPTIDEQREIVRRVEELFKLADGIKKRVAKATKRAEALTQSILAKAFHGELVPTEADLARREGRDYESAEQLLERIQATKHAAGAGRKSRRSSVARKQR